MYKDSQVPVLIVGAGPVGLLTALLLAKNGVQVEIIDMEDRTAAFGYACALHARSLEVLERAGLSTQIRESGFAIESIAFYEGAHREAVVHMSELPARFPYLISLPQWKLESLLEGMLAEAGVRVQWHHRLTAIEPSAAGVRSQIEKLSVTGHGYSVPTTDPIVQRTLRVNSSYLVGADGCNSSVREALGIEFEYMAPPEDFALYEAQVGGNLEREVRIVFEQSRANALWPLSENRCRWAFELMDGAPKGGEWRCKERSAIHLIQPDLDEREKRRLAGLLQERAPWFENKVEQIEWAQHVQFENRLARKFGEGRCWLVGDAAHQNGPLGVQSLNAGLCEAEELAGLVTKTLRKQLAPGELENYDARRRHEWEVLLPAAQSLGLRRDPHFGASRDVYKIASCIPATGADFAHLTRQLGLDLAAVS